MRTILICLLILSCAAPSWAHWVVDPNVPEWCRRGDLHWALHYGKVTRSDVELMVAAGQNLNHGASYDSPDTAARAAAAGIRDLVYVCSRTFTVKAREQSPLLAQAAVLAFDGSEVLAYGNPVRRYGCVNSPEWKAYVISKVEQVRAKRLPAGIFFDNAGWFNLCYCPTCKGMFHDFSRRLYGKEMELPEKADLSTQAGRAARLFLLERHTAYHKALLEYCHGCKPPLLCVPNGAAGPAWPMSGIEEGMSDLPFYERFSHPPFEDNLYAYKVALAAGHGRTVGNLMYLPEAQGSARGKRTWNEGMHHDFFPASPLAKEFALAIAEGAACDASYVACYNLFPALPITDAKDPFNQGIYQVMNRTYGFLTKQRALYLNADQGADLAILHSARTDLFGSWSRLWAGMAQRLNRAGIPYEVITDRDLEPALLRRYRGIVVTGVRSLSEAGAASLSQYVRDGGRVLFAGECGVTDERGEPRPNRALQGLLAVGRIRQYDVATDLRLEGFAPEPGGQRLWLAPGVAQGKASLRFDGAAGRYKVAAMIMDESDGASAVRLLVNGKPAAEWLLDEDKDGPRWLSTVAALRPGDDLSLHCTLDGGEMCRLMAFTLQDPRAEEGLPVGKGRILVLSRDITGADGKTLRALAERLLGTPALSVANANGTVAVNVLTQPGLRQVHLLNYDYQYDAPAGRIADDDGSPEARSHLSGPAWRIRKVLHVPDPKALVQPTLEIVGNANSPKKLIRLVVAVNGTDLAPVPAEELRGTFTLPVPAGRLVAGDNEVVLRLEGPSSTTGEWYQVRIDTNAAGGRSFFSLDAGRTWSRDDLSRDRQEQRGEFLIRLTDPENRPTHAQWEEMCRVRPARDVRVFVAGRRAPSAVALSPDAPAQPVAGRKVAGGFELPVNVEAYTVLVLADDARKLRALAP